VPLPAPILLARPQLGCPTVVGDWPLRLSDRFRVGCPHGAALLFRPRHWGSVLLCRGSPTLLRGVRPARAVDPHGATIRQREAALDSSGRSPSLGPGRTDRADGTADGWIG